MLEYVDTFGRFDVYLDIYEDIYYITLEGEERTLASYMSLESAKNYCESNT